MRSINKMSQWAKELSSQEAAMLAGASSDADSISRRAKRIYARCGRALLRIMDKHITSYSEKSLTKRYKAVYRRYGADRVNAILSYTAAALPKKEKTAMGKDGKPESVWGSITDEYGKNVQFEDWRPRSYDAAKVSHVPYFSVAIKILEKPSEEKDAYIKYLPMMADRFAAMERSNCDMSRPHYKNKKGKEILCVAIPACAIEKCEDGRTFLRLPRKGTKDDAEWRISLTKYSEIDPNCGDKAPDGRVMISIPKGLRMKVLKNAENDKQAKFRITAESLSTILYHATEDDYAPDKARPRLTKEEKERFDAATKGCVYGKQTRDLFDGKEKKGDLGKSRENFMARLAFIFDGNKKSMAHVFECSGLNNGMSPEERKALADTACKKIKKHYSDVMGTSSSADKWAKTVKEFNVRSR